LARREEILRGARCWIFDPVDSQETLTGPATICREAKRNSAAAPASECCPDDSWQEEGPLLHKAGMRPVFADDPGFDYDAGKLSTNLTRKGVSNEN
jgi:hypothetical protein